MGVKVAPVNSTHVVLAAMAIGVAWYLYNDAKKAAAKVADKVNPVNPDNVFYEGVNAVGEAVTGSEKGGWSLGSWIYDVTHPNEAEKLGL